MTSFLNKVFSGYQYLFYELNDHRTKNWWLMSGPVPVIIIVATYLYFCTSFGPKFMEKRKPYDLKKIVLIYNILQISMNLFTFYEGARYMLSKEFNFYCEIIDYSNSPRAVRAAGTAWWYFILKITELLDTVFFVLRKKSNQLSFLHIYHHSMMSISVWISVKYFPGGHAFLMGTFNSFVHIVMYAYYMISGLGPQYQKYVWWKKHVTVLQLVQFITVFVHNIIPFCIKCDYPKALNLAMIFNASFFLYMFGKFFYLSYTKNPSKKFIDGFDNGKNGKKKCY